MKTHFFILIMFTISVRSFSQNKGIEDEITRLEMEWHDAYKLKDTANLKRILADAFINIDRAGNQYGKAAIINALKSDKADYHSIYPYDMHFYHYGNTVTVVGKTR